MAFSELDAIEKGEVDQSMSKSPSDLASTPTQLGSMFCLNPINSFQKNVRAEDVTSPRSTGSIAFV
jgi:hypothetical protein